MTPLVEGRSRLAELAEGALHENLSGAIRAFNERTDELRREYERLRRDFERVNVELTLRNRELAESLKEVDEVRAHLASVLESLSVGVVSCDLSGRVTLANPALEALTGYRAGDLRGGPVPAGFPSTDVCASARPAELIRADGESIPVECDSVLVQSGSGEPQGRVMLMRDLRSVRELEREVERSRTLAALGELAAGIVHEVRNPLGGIEGFGSLLVRALEPADPRHRLATRILDGVGDLKRIVDDLLVLARPAALHMRPVALDALITRSADLALHGWDTGEGHVEVFVEHPGAGLAVLADARTLTQVLVNLLRNAAEAMPGGGRITVNAAAESDETVAVTIEDTGPGIDPGVRDKIFTPFFTTKEKGTGLGLFIASTIVRAHGGAITIDSTEGEGTRVKLSLGRVMTGAELSAA